MSGVNGKGQRSIKKKSVEESLIPSITFKTIRFMHEATEGDTVIDTGSLVAPTEAVNNGFAQPSASELGALNLLQYKNKVVVRSTVRPAMLQFLDYKITGAATINLIVPALDGEVFEVIVSDDAKSGVTAVDATPLVRSFVLTAGNTDVSVGNYPVGKYPNEQLGALLVFEDGQLLNRTVGNQPDGDGDYYELANVIRLVNTDTEDRNIVVVSHSAIIEEPEGSLLSMIESLAGQVDGIIPTLAALAGVPETDFQAAPNNADTKAFGDRVFANENDIANLKPKLVFEPKIQTYRATGTGGRASNNEFILDTPASNINVEGSGLFSITAATASEGTRFTALKRIKLNVHFNAGGPATQRGFSIILNGSTIVLGTASITAFADSGHTSATLILNEGDVIAGFSTQSGFTNSQIILYAESRELVSLENL